MIKVPHKVQPSPKIYKMGEHDLVHIGPHTYTNNGLNVDWWGGDARLRIGSYCSVADDVKFFLSHGHRIDWITSYPFARGDDYWLAGRKFPDGVVCKGDIVIGSDVWIGNGARILSGVTIGHGAVIGTGAVVSRDVPPYAFVAGNPARIIRYRFDEKRIAELLAIAWWDWPEDKVRRHLDALLDSDVGRFREQVAQDPDLSPIVAQTASVTPRPDDTAVRVQELVRSGRIPEAVALAEAAVAEGTADTLLSIHLMQLYLHAGRNQETWDLGQRVIEREPANVDAHFQLGLAGMRINQYEDALGHFAFVLERAPDNVEALTNQAAVHFGLGQIRESLNHLDRALKLSPDLVPVWQNYISILNYDEDVPLARLMERHRKAGRRIARLTPKVPASYANDPSPDRRLRIGYLSGDFFNHPAAHYIEPVLRLHDRANFDIYAYSLIGWSDPVTKAFQGHVPNWRDVSLLDDESLFRTIQADGIDILIDLSGHTARNRILLMARKPAPVTVNWIGYLNTIGIPSYDYAILDPHLLSRPAESGFVERVWRLPHSAYCYTPLIGDRPVAPAPCQTNGYVTFGCFNNPAKLSRVSLNAWAQILKAMPDSRLLFKYKTYSAESVQRRVIEAMVAQNVDSERLVFEGFSPLGSFFDTFGSIDVALDSFPYTGVTTTMHTLFMGVPLVSLEGDTPMQRFGRTALTAIDHTDWIARSPQDYVAIAIRLAKEAKTNPGLRQEIRQRMLASPLMCHDVFVRDLEAAYRGMWQRWCASHARR